MTLALAAAIGVLVGWFGNPLWFRIVDRIWVWRMRRQNRRSPAPPSTLASVAEMYKRLYAPDSMPKPAMPAMRFSDARKFHVVGAIDDGHAVTHPNAAAEVEAAVAEAHERLSRDSLAAGEVVDLADWIPKSTPDEDKP